MVGILRTIAFVINPEAFLRFRACDRAAMAKLGIRWRDERFYLHGAETLTDSTPRLRLASFHGTPMGWLIHGAPKPRGISTNRHSECAQALLSAGSLVDEASLPTGHDGVDKVLREHLLRDCACGNRRHQRFNEDH
jgi:hypothetical protein